MDAPSNSNKFGQWLLSARTLRGLNATDLAAKVGVSQPAITGYETGRRNPKRGTVIKIAEALGVGQEEPLLMAGFSADYPHPNPALEAIALRLSQLSEQDQARVLDMIERLSVPQEPQR